MNIRKIIQEELKIVFGDTTVSINVGDEILGGKFKNKKIKVKEIGKVAEGYHLKFYKNHEQDRIIPTSVEINEGIKEIEISFDYP